MEDGTVLSKGADFVKTIKMRLILVIVGVSLLTTLLIGGFFIYNMIQTSNEGLVTYQSELRGNVERELRLETESAISVINSYYKKQQAGELTPEQAKTDVRRSVLLQCIGASEEVYPDMFFGDTKLNAVYMLCSDGFRHEISNEEIYNSLNPNVMVDAEGMKCNMQSLVELNKQRQERDNISVITVRTF